MGLDMRDEILKKNNGFACLYMGIVYSVCSLSLIGSSKMFTFGQTKPFMKSPENFVLFLRSILTVPSIELNELNELNATKLSIILKEQIDKPLNSTNIRYLDFYLRTIFDWSIQVHRLLWPTIAYLMIAVFCFIFIRCSSPIGLFRTKTTL